MLISYKVNLYKVWCVSDVEHVITVFSNKKSNKEKEKYSFSGYQGDTKDIISKLGLKKYGSVR